MTQKSQEQENSPLPSSFGFAPIIKEGGIADHDAFTWECQCEVCKSKYQKWKKEFDKEQKELRGKA